MAVPLWAKLLLLASVSGSVTSLTPPAHPPTPVSTESHGEEGHGDTAVSACRAAQIAAEGWSDAFVPSCTDAGLFKRRQCHMFVRSCWCVDPVTGDEIADSRRQFGEGVLDCDKHVSESEATTHRVSSLSTPAPLPSTESPFHDPETGESHTLDSPCLAAQEAASSRPEAHMPLCTTSGLYQRQQCHYLINSCWCVDPDTGVEVEGSRKGLDEGDVTCDKPANPIGPCHVALARTRPLVGAYVPQCTEDGKYLKRQCHGSTGSCWCVNEDGTEVEGSRKGPSDGKVDCEENAKPSGPCHLAVARIRPLFGSYVPQCTDDGKYQKQQCHASTGYCWCVNEDGAEVEGTRKGPSDGKVDCEEDAKPTDPCYLALVRIRRLVGAYVPQCTDDGKYLKRQCHASTGSCWCVNEDGTEVEGTRKGPGDGKIDCEKAAPTRNSTGGSDARTAADGGYTPTPTPLPASVSTPAGRESESAQPRSCSLPPVLGSCLVRGSRWYFDRETETCKQFSGCEGVGNNFGSQIACEFSCPARGCPAVDCELSCEFGYQLDANKCRLCRCNDDPCSKVDCRAGQTCEATKVQCGDAECPWTVRCRDNIRRWPSGCSLPAFAGTCSNHTVRWYHSPTGCTTFQYGGCGGNENNFETQSECIRTCGAPCRNDGCWLVCPLGYVKEAGDCDTCTCFSPCSDVKCPAGQTCVARKVCNPSPCKVVTQCSRLETVIEKTASACKDPADIGEGGTYYLRWYYSSVMRECRRFYYRGRFGSRNNFDRKEDCERTCAPTVCTPVRCRMRCPFGFARDNNGCEICQCLNPCKDVECPAGEHCQPELPFCPKPPCAAVPRCLIVRPQLPRLCSLGFNAGLCSTVAPKWFYNVTSDKCQMQNFSSCRGNTNRFDNKTQCMTTCMPNACKPPACARVCPFGLAEDDNGCEICECFNPCKDVTCKTGEICMPGKESCEQGPCPVVGKCYGGTFPTIKDRCTLQVEVGRCSRSESRWFFNVTSDQCEAFLYTGCYGNDNRFETRSDCKKACERHHCQPIRCKMDCPFEWAKDEHGCDICKCINPCEKVTCRENEKCLPERQACVKSPCPVVGKCFVTPSDLNHKCVLAVDVGRCNSRELKWFFNLTSSACQAFNYTGCRGNTNRFNSKADCRQTCEPHHCQPVRCKMDCPFEWAKDEHGCDICKCVNPCEKVTCRENEKCFPERQACVKSPCPVVGKCFVTPSDMNHKCLLAVDVGRCNSRELKWFYNLTSSACQAFNYTGCRGNYNRFNSKAECNQTCVPHRCEPARCKEKCPFGSVKDDNGCDTCQCIDPCKDVQCPEGDRCVPPVGRCEPIQQEVKCKPPRCRMLCPFGWKKDENGCDICRCHQPCKGLQCGANERCLPQRLYCTKRPCPVIGRCFAKRPDLDPKCTLAQEAGICDSIQLKWFFNLTSNRCEAFNYTGCRGNYNRFNSKDECKQTCETHRCEPARCKDKCPFGSVKDVNGCDTCRCIDPCEEVECAEGQHCVPEQVQCFRSPCPPIGKCYPNRPHVECKPNACRIFCPFGRAKDDDGCDICQCINPCKNVDCADNERCLPERLYCTKSPCPAIGRCFAKRPDLEPECTLALEVGLCDLRERKWFFNLTSNKCEAFNFTGCRSNGNKFDSERACMTTCMPNKCGPGCQRFCPYGFVKDKHGCDTCHCINPCAGVSCSDGKRCFPERRGCNTTTPCPVTGKCIAVRTDVPALCSVPADYGLCKNHTTRWYFDTEADACVQFVYSGCRGNMNNFVSKPDCVARCVPSYCAPIACEPPCVTEKGESGCDVCTCGDPCKHLKCTGGAICDADKGLCVMVKTVPEKCKLPPKTGMCRAYFRRWFYNATSGACERFVYGGCQANANNFRKKEQCEEACLPAPCPDVTKCPWCEHGLATNERGCTVCECSVNPCTVVDCGGNTKCEVVKGNCSGPGCQTVAKCVPQNATKCPDVMCARFCEYGLERGPDGCRVCRCSNPCKSVNCGPGFKCKVKQCSDRDPDCRSVGICVPWQVSTTDIPVPLLVKPGMCPERAQMGAGICAEMCSYDVSCPDQQKCCSNGCGHVCMDPVLNTTTPATGTTVTVTTERPARMNVTPDVCPDGSTWRNCSGVCEQVSSVSCEGLDEARGRTQCRTDPCNACHYTVVKTDTQTETLLCTGWLCPATRDSRPCDVRHMCAARPTCQWMPDAKCVDDLCTCRPTFVADYNQVVDCDTESTLCLRMRSRALAQSQIVSDLWVPDCDESGDFKPVQTSYASKWCVDPLGRLEEDTERRHDENIDCAKRTFTSVKAILWMNGLYDSDVEDKEQFARSMETQLADAMMVSNVHVDEDYVKESDGAFACAFSVRANETDHLSLVSKADRFERLVHAGNLYLMNLPVDQRSERRFRFSFVYAEEPRTASSKEELGRGVIIAITVIACAALLAVMLVGMVCLACRRRQVYQIEEKSAIPAFENPRYMSTDDLKEKL